MKYILLIVTIILISACESPPLARMETAVPDEQAKLTPTIIVTNEVKPVIEAISPVATPTKQPTSSPIDKPAPTPEKINYSFGSPELILETTTPIKFAQWLSGSNEDLLVQSATTDKYTIEILNIATGNRKRLVETENLVASPVWLWATQEVAYVNQGEDGITRLNFSKADQKNAIREMSSQIYPVVSPAFDGASVFVFDEGMSQLQQIGQTGRTVEAFTQAEPLPIIEGGPFARYRVAWSDNITWVVYYNKEKFRLVNTETGEYQDIDLGSSPDGKLWVSCAHWSPNGQKLALIVAAGDDSPLRFTKLAIFDPKANQLQIIEDDVIYVTDIAWAPDNQQVLITGVVGLIDGFENRSLLLADIETQQVKHIPSLPEDALGGSFCDGLAWSPDGSQIAIPFGQASDVSKIGWYRIDVKHP